MSRFGPPAVAGDSLADVDTPALLIDLDAFEANLAAVHGFVTAHGGRVRSHGKALAIGPYLTESERASLAEALRGAISARRSRGPLAAPPVTGRADP